MSRSRPKGLSLRARAVQGYTDYRHRRKYLVNHQNYVRIRYGKKNNYIHVACHRTWDVGQPDLSNFYFDSRWLRHQDKVVKPNGHLAYVVGVHTAQWINENGRDYKYILDLGFQKKIRYFPFVVGLLRTLDPQVVFKHGFTKEQVDAYQEFEVDQYVVKPKKQH